MQKRTEARKHRCLVKFILNSLVISVIIISGCSMGENTRNTRSQKTMLLGKKEAESLNTQGMLYFEKMKIEIKNNSPDTAKLYALYAMKYLDSSINSYERAVSMGVFISPFIQGVDMPPSKNSHIHNSNKGIMLSKSNSIITSGLSRAIFQIWKCEMDKEKEALNSIVFSRDGKILASGAGAENHDIRLWESATGNEIGIFSGHTDDILSLDFSPDGKILASASTDQTIRLWNIRSGKQIRKITGDFFNIICLNFSPDGKNLATVGNDRTIRLWDVKTGQNTQRFREEIKNWTPLSFKTMKPFKGHRITILTVNYSPDAKWLATGGLDHSIQIWNLELRKHEKCLIGHKSPTVSASFSPDGRYIASGGLTRSIHLWDLNTGKQLDVINEYSACDLCFSKDSKILISKSCGSGRIRKFKIKDGLFNDDSTSDLSSKNKMMDFGFDNWVHHLWMSKEEKMIVHKNAIDKDCCGICISPNGQLIATVENQIIQLWDGDTGSIKAIFYGFPETCKEIEFSEDGNTLIAISLIKTNYFWDLELFHILNSSPVTNDFIIAFKKNRNFKMIDEE